jgi:hypothetical protein
MLAILHRAAAAAATPPLALVHTHGCSTHCCHTSRHSWQIVACVAGVQMPVHSATWLLLASSGQRGQHLTAGKGTAGNPPKAACNMQGNVDSCLGSHAATFCTQGGGGGLHSGGAPAPCSRPPAHPWAPGIPCEEDDAAFERCLGTHGWLPLDMHAVTLPNAPGA